MNILTKKLLQDLFRASDGLYIFTLYQRFNVSPKELYLTINELVEKKIILSDEDRLSLTSEGKEFVINSDISIKKAKNKSEKIPSEFLGRRIEINEFYLPTSKDIQNQLLSLRIIS